MSQQITVTVALKFSKADVILLVEKALTYALAQDEDLTLRQAIESFEDDPNWLEASILNRLVAGGLQPITARSYTADTTERIHKLATDFLESKRIK